MTITRKPEGIPGVDFVPVTFSMLDVGDVFEFFTSSKRFRKVSTRSYSRANDHLGRYACRAGTAVFVEAPPA